MTSTGPDAFGHWLDLTMTNRGIKGRQIARTLRVHESAVSRWRAGNGVPSIDTCLRLAQFLNIDPPIRLAVTAGLIDGGLIGVDPLPMPEPTVQRKTVKEQIRKIRGLSARERQRLIDLYDDMETETAS